MGRDAELGALRSIVRSTSTDGAATVLLSGEAGIGKSRLADELRQAAEAEGVLVATGWTPVRGTGLPYGTVVALVRDLSRRLEPAVDEHLEPVRRALLGIPGGDPTGADLARLLLFETVLQAVDAVAAARPVLLVLEDLHWADDGTFELLDHLVRNLDRQPVAVLGTYRPEEVAADPAAHRLLLELGRHPAVTVCELEGLGREELATLLLSATGEAPSWSILDAVHQRSGGNPLFAEELAAVRHGSGVPPGLRDLLLARIDGLSDDAAHLVSAAAVIGTACEHRLLAAVVDLDAPTLDRALREAVRHGVLVVDGAAGRIRFRHELLREAAHDALLPPTRSRLHGCAARVLESQPSLSALGPGHAAAELAAHHAEAGDLGATCAWSLEAAAAARAVGAMRAARDHLERAVMAHGRAAGGCGHADVDDAELLLRAADAHYQVGEVEPALRHARAAEQVLADDAPIDRRIACSVMVSRASMAAGLREESMAVADRALELARTGGDRQALAEAATNRARLSMLGAPPEVCRDRCEEALHLVRAAGSRLLEGHLLATLAAVLSQLGELRAAAEAGSSALAIAEELGAPDLLSRAAMNRTYVLVAAADLPEVVRIARAAIADTGPFAAVRLGAVSVNALEAMAYLGLWSEATALLEGTESDAPIPCATGACAGKELVRAILALRRGDLEAAGSALDDCEATDELTAAQRDLLRAEVAADDGRPEDALAAAELALSRSTRFDATITALRAHAVSLRAIADLLAAPVRRGRRASVDTAKLHRAVELTMADVDDISAQDGGRPEASPWVTALVAVCRAEASRAHDPDPEAWLLAADAMARIGDRYAVAGCRYREAEALLAGRGDRQRARSALASAWRASVELGAIGLAARCRQLSDRGRLNAPDPAADDGDPQARVAGDLGLTGREVEVLDLLTLDRTDGQIAEELFISKKTASVHVSNILRKLDARDRWHAGEIGRGAGLGERDGDRVVSSVEGGRDAR